MANVLAKGDRNWRRKVRAKARADEIEEAEMSEGEKTKGAKPQGKMSGLDAAFKVLSDRESAVRSAVAKAANSNGLGIAEREKAAAGAEKHKGLRCADICERALKRGLWSPKGKTPAATLASAISREIKGTKSRFKKVGRGEYSLA